MAAITYSTASKVTHLERINTEEDKYLEPNELGARVRVAKIDFTASGTQTAPVILAKFDKPVTILDMVFAADAAITSIDLGTTPQSLPVDGTTDILSATAVVANVPQRPYGANGLVITVPSFVVMSINSGNLADTKILYGHILYVDNS